MKQRLLGNSDIVVSSIGLGVMGMSPGMYGETNDEESMKSIHHALDIGVTLLDPADVYGNGHIELTPDDLAHIEMVSPKNEVHGTRYMKEMMTQLNG
ncbi:aldo/keto reductase [Paenibacillus sp. FSL H8-0079]|uniref:aldo/keto reductase n=1 Tax=Paenibacillus sp. FSL H8-0079 TaxID=2921375 RepID=UPI0030EE34D2